MKLEDLSVGAIYSTMVSGERVEVVLVDPRELVNKGKPSKQQLVVVRSKHQNLMYRTPGQLRKA